VLSERGSEPLQSRLTPHSLRRTFASLLFAVGEHPPYVMAQMGHTTANLTLAVYAREMDRRDGEPERIKALVEGRDWAASGQQEASTMAEAVDGLAA
jgi:integrase